ncbi:MAG: LacI family transcriptional regulator [Eubacterium sp.]|nr:LacI family transcriptional regulator [Eubacterium sp.]
MSLKKIAQLAETSVSTVSRVLNDPAHRCHNPGLTEKIWQIADSLHYVPNPATRRLRLGSSDKIEPFTVDLFLARFDSIDKDPFFRELFWYLKEELIQHNCLLGEIQNPIDMANLPNSNAAPEHVPYKPMQKVLSEKTKNALAFIARKPNTGLLILGKCPPELVPIVKKRYSFLVGIDRNPTEYEFDEVVCNGQAAAELAVEHLIRLGHENIAYIGDCTYETRYIGYYQALINHKISLNYENIYPTDQTQEQGFHAMTALLSSSRRPTAIFCANDSTALGVLNALKRHKKKGYFPSIISIDNINDSQKTVPMLTTIDIPKKEMGHLALMLLLDRKNGGHHENVRLELPCRLIERDSCTNPPHK